MNSKSRYVSAATKLLTKRKELHTAYEELEKQKKQHDQESNECKRKEEELRKNDLKIQEDLITFYKKLQDNEFQKQKAEDKLGSELQFKAKREEQIKSLNQDLEYLQVQQKKLECRVNSLQKYYDYLNSVHQSNLDQFTDIADISRRYKILKGSHKTLEEKREKSEKERLELDREIITYEKKKADEMQKLIRDNGFLKNKLEELERERGDQNEKIELSNKLSSQDKAVIGKIYMAIDNLSNRCIEINKILKDREERKAIRNTGGKVGQEKKGNDEGKNKEDELEKQLFNVNSAVQKLKLVKDNALDYKELVTKYRPEFKKATKQNFLIIAKRVKRNSS